MASSAQICGFLLLPEREDAFNAITRTIGKIRLRYGDDAQAIANRLKQPNGKPPDKETIKRAERQETMLSFDLIAQLVTVYHDCAEPILALLQPTEPITLEQRLQRAEAEILAVRRALPEAETNEGESE